MPFVIGETIGPYTLMEQLGQGGMATVFKAYHPTLDRYVAIKVLHLAFMEEASFLERFRREAKAVAKLEHPNIVPIYDFSEYESRPFLVMKYIEGETLKARLRKRALTTDETLDIIKAIGSALDFAHKQGVLHRDVKPSNVLLADDGNIYLADYGLARIAQSGDVSLTTEHILGTPQYMSPEQALGSDGLDGRTDIYSFGVLLYEMVTGRVPFNADTPFAIIHDHIYTALPLPREINAEVSQSVERVLLKALAKNKDDRYQTMADFIAAFERALISPDDPAYHSARQIVSAPVQENRSGQTSVTKNDKAKKKKRRWIFIVPVFLLGGALACYLSLAVLGAIFENSGKVQTDDLEPYLSELLDTPSAAIRGSEYEFQQTVSVLAETEPDEDMADQLLEDSISAWHRGNLPAARIALIRMYFASGRDEVFLRDAFKSMTDEGAWVLIAETLYMSDRANAIELTKNMKTFIHQVLYMAAEDPLAKNLFEKNRSLPIFEVATLRYDVLLGDIGTSKEALGLILDDPVKVKEFPEAHLLEGEIFKKLGDDTRAAAIFDEIMEDEATPEWIWNVAFELSLSLE
ncbi:MAG: serine/threonine protein kinase [Anaerolineaceae bacterium]|nr:serine/threonine protein kinase [Anaerolineaceae bacterium]